MSVVEGPESQEVALSAPKKRKIPVGIVLPNQVSFMVFSSHFCKKCRFGWRNSYSFWMQ